MEKTELKIATPLTLPCGLTLPNRLVRAAMAEGWADADRLPSQDLIRAYASWADGGWGMVLTGNVQVDERHLGSAQDNALNDRLPRHKMLASWTEWARVAGRHATPTVMQLNHPGRQSPLGAGTRGLLAKTIGPSAVPLQLGPGLVSTALRALVFGTPRAMTADDIHDVVARFADAAKLASDAGFAGVEIHAAHGYLLAQFLSAQSNRRSDDYGGTARKRARIVVDVVRAVRKAVPPGFCVGIKLNSVDHQSEPELAECFEQLEDIVAAGIDFLEISGGTYENPSMVLGTSDGVRSARTAAREAFFLDFANAIRDRFAHVPLVVTGGFRTRQGMESAVKDKACDMVGVARPAVLNPSLPKNTIFNAEIKDDNARLYTKTVTTPWFLKKLGIRAITGGAETMWYQNQIHKIFSSH